MPSPWRIQRYTSLDIAGRELEEAIIAFDKMYMAPLLEKWGIPFPEDKRRRGLSMGRTLQMAMENEGHIVGYIEYGPDWGEATDVYISSVQVAPPARRSALFARLVASAIHDLASQPFRRVISHVQKQNHEAIALYRRLGFTVHEDRPSATSFPVSADRTILQNRLIMRFHRDRLRPS